MVEHAGGSTADNGGRTLYLNRRNPSPDDTCEQFNQRAVYSLQQVYGTNNVTIFTKTAARFPSVLMVPVKVFNGSDNSPCGCRLTFRASGDSSIANMLLQKSLLYPRAGACFSTMHMK